MVASAPAGWSLGTPTFSRSRLIEFPGVNSPVTWTVIVTHPASVVSVNGISTDMGNLAHPDEELCPGKGAFTCRLGAVSTASTRISSTQTRLTGIVGSPVSYPRNLPGRYATFPDTATFSYTSLEYVDPTTGLNYLQLSMPAANISVLFGRRLVLSSPAGVVKARSRIIVSGVAQQLRYGKTANTYIDTWAAARSLRVSLYFDPVGTAPATRVATLITDSLGRFTYAPVARTSGSWYVTAAGGGAFASAVSKPRAMRVA
ncbi:MAG: hypothetical protein U0R65_15980 [Candidatus Nanopelagicales bacterium]